MAKPDEPHRDQFDEPNEPMGEAERKFRTSEAFREFLEHQFPGFTVEKENPRSMTADVFIVSRPPESYVVAIIDEVIATVLNNGGYLDEAGVADIFDRGNILSEMKKRRGAPVVICNLNGDVL
jgi:hypothetical protein